MSWFQDSKGIEYNELIGKPIILKSVVLQNKGKGTFGIFLAIHEGKAYSFCCGAKVIMGLVTKYFGAKNIPINLERIIDFPDEMHIALLQKKSKDGKYYIDFEWS